jgi:hypothetical protein
MTIRKLKNLVFCHPELAHPASRSEAGVSGSQFLIKFFAIDSEINSE